MWMLEGVMLVVDIVVVVSKSEGVERDCGCLTGGRCDGCFLLGLKRRYIRISE